MRQIWIAAMCLLIAACASSPQPSVTPLDHLSALTGDYFALDSREAGHRYHIYIRYPESYADKPAQRYPIVYLLDGDSLFPLLASTQLFIEYDDDLPEALVVGIAYGSFDPPQNRRRHDFTVGATDFSRFLERELIPAVERRVRAQSDHRILFGQSRGGGYVLHSAFSNPDLFRGRIANNPTLDLLPALALKPASASRADLRLMVAGGTLDSPQIRDPLLQWFARWRDRSDLPWALRTEIIEGGTHAADAGRVYRLAMAWLLAAPPPAGATER